MVDLDAVKARAAAQEPTQQPPQQRPAADKPKISAERQAEIDRFTTAYAQENAPEIRVPFAAAADPNVKAATPAPEAPAPREQFRSTFDTPERKAWVEANCTAMDFGELILTGRVTQNVPLLKGKMTVRYQSLLGEETFWMEQRARDMVGAQQSAVPGAMAWSVYARLALSVQLVNGSPLTSHITQNGDAITIDAEAVEKRVHQVLRLGERVVELMLVNQSWFEERVTKLFEDDFESLKNG